MNEYGEAHGWREPSLPPYMQPFDERYVPPQDYELSRSRRILTQAVVDKFAVLFAATSTGIYCNVIYRELGLKGLDMFGVPVRIELFAFDKVAHAGLLPEYGVSVLRGSKPDGGFRYQHEYTIPEEVLADEGVARFDVDWAAQRPDPPFISLDPVSQELEQVVGYNGLPIGEREASIIAGMIASADLAA